MYGKGIIPRMGTMPSFTFLIVKREYEGPISLSRQLQSSTADLRRRSKGILHRYHLRELPDQRAR